MTFLLKIVLAGDMGVGKNTLMDRHLGKIIQYSYSGPIRFKMSVKTISSNGRHFKIYFWLLPDRNNNSIHQLVLF